MGQAAAILPFSGVLAKTARYERVMLQAACHWMIRMNQDFSSRRVVITGGAGGIGETLARRLLALGALVVLADCDRAALLRVASALNGEVGLCECDISSDQDCSRLIQVAETYFQAPIDVFVANAGIPFAGPLQRASVNDITRVIAVNVIGSILSARAAIGSLANGVDPCLVFMGSLQSVTGRAERSVYTASKHAIAGLVKSLALELGPQGIRVNAVAPTVLDTPFLHQAYERAGIPVEQGLAQAAQGLPLRRIPTLEDVAATILFLSSPATRSMTGQIVMVDCGATAGKM